MVLQVVCWAMFWNCSIYLAGTSFAKNETFWMTAFLGDFSEACQAVPRNTPSREPLQEILVERILTDDTTTKR
jgi:hypothetical protein